MLAQLKKIKISRVTEDLLPEGVPGVSGMMSPSLGSFTRATSGYAFVPVRPVRLLHGLAIVR